VPEAVGDAAGLARSGFVPIGRKAVSFSQKWESPVRIDFQLSLVARGFTKPWFTPVTPSHPADVSPETRDVVQFQSTSTSEEVDDAGVWGDEVAHVRVFGWRSGMGAVAQPTTRPRMVWLSMCASKPFAERMYD